MARSKSETPKASREAYLPAKVLKPSATDYLKTAAYIDQQAANLTFAKAPGGTITVLHYLWRHTVRNLSKSLGPRERIGWVLTGKSNRAKIAAENGLSYSQVGKIIDWLDAEGWIKKQLGKGNDMSILMLLNQGLAETSTPEEDTLYSVGVDPLLQESTPSTLTSRTIQGSYEDSTRTTSRADDESPLGDTPSGIDLELLATSLGSSSLGPNLVSLANSLATAYGPDVVLSVAERCRASARINPAGLFVSSGKDMCEQALDMAQKALGATETPEYDFHARQDARKAEHARKMEEARARARARRAA